MRWLRISVPAGIAAALLVVVVANYMPTGGLRLPGELGKLVIKGTKITMEQPRLTGYTAASRPYEFTARAAAQEITEPDVMELEQIRAKIEMEDDSRVNITSNSGIYDLKADLLTLTDNVHLVSSTGYEVRLSEAVVDVHKGHVVSEKPVWVKLTNGIVNAKRMEVSDSGDVIRFGGGVAVTMHPDQEFHTGKRSMTRRLTLWAVVMALAAPGSAAAQGPHAAATSPSQSIVQDQNQGQPIQIKSATLEVRDKNKMATFSGDVVVVQGDTTIKCQTLVVFYGAEHGPGAAPPVAAAAQSGEGATGGGARSEGAVCSSGRPGHPPDRSPRRRHHHHQGSNCDRRSWRLRPEKEDDDADRKRRCQPRQERPPRRQCRRRHRDRRRPLRVRRHRSKSRACAHSAKKG